MPTMFIDLLFIAILGYGILRAYRSGGLLDSATGFMRIIISLVLGAKVSYLFADRVSDVTVVSASYVPVVAFLLGFVGIMMLFRFMNIFFEAITGDYYKQWMTVTGIFTWLFISGLSLSSLIYWGENNGMITNELTNYSRVYPYVADLYPIISCKLSFLWPALDNMFNAMLNILGELGGSLKGECF